MAAKIHDSAFGLAKAVAKTQLLLFRTWSLPCSLPCYLGSAAWNMFIPQGRLFGALKCVVVFPSPLPCQELRAAFQSCWLCFFLPPCPANPNSPPSIALMHRSLRCVYVQIGCYFLRYRCSAFHSFKWRDQRRSLMPPCFSNYSRHW